MRKARKRKPTDDPEVAGEDEHSEIVVSDEDEVPSLSPSAHQDAKRCAISPTIRSTKPGAGSHVQVNETQETLPIAEKTQSSELFWQQDRSSEDVMNMEGACPCSCPSKELAEPTVPASPVPKGIRRRWKQEPLECTSTPPTSTQRTSGSRNRSNKQPQGHGEEPGGLLPNPVQ